jgi:photosystem II stability/assembly factor-like uncharacterized protein
MLQPLKHPFLYTERRRDMRFVFRSTVILLGLHLTFGHSYSQEWTPLSPVTGWAQTLASHQGTTLLMSQPGGIYRSTDGGTSWTKGTPDALTAGATSMISDGVNIYAARGTAGVMRSTDDGLTWVEANTGLPGGRTASGLAVSGGTLFVGLDFSGGLYASTDGGTSWMRSDSGMVDRSVLVVAGRGDTVFAGTGDGHVYRSTNHGTFWTDVSPGVYGPENNLSAILVTGKLLVIG